MGWEMCISDGLGGGVADPPPRGGVGDYDGDGNTDVAFFLPGDFGGILFGAGDGTLPKQNVFGLYPGLPGTVAALDLNGDNKTDLLVADSNLKGVISYVNQTGVATVGSASTATSLSVAPNPAAVGASVTFTATVAGSINVTPTGTVSFLDGSSALGSAALSAQGTATFSSTSLASGTHPITAQYSGDGTFAGSTSAAESLMVGSATADFTIAATPVAGTVAAGQSASTLLTFTPANGFTGAVNLTCSGLPAGAACSFSPASIDIAGAAGNSTLTISTAVRTAQLDAAPRGWTLDPVLPGGSVVLAGFGVPAWVLRGRRRRESRSARTWTWVALILVSAAVIQGCHGHSHGGASMVGGTPAGTYIVTVTATSGSTSHSLAYALTVS